MDVIKRLLLGFVAITGAAAMPAQAQIYEGKAEVIDGDSLEMTGVRLRLFGIDAVEARQTCDRDGKVWLCGEEATSRLRSLVAGQILSCSQRDEDLYGRIVAVCTVRSRDLSQEMVRMGLAIALPEFTRDYVEWENLARENITGIWASEFQKPADFRASDPHSVRAERDAFAAMRRRSGGSLEKPVSRAVSSPRYFATCAAARAAGAAPIYRGQPGYRGALDGDADGIACEPYRGQR